MSTITGQRANTVIYGWLWLPGNAVTGSLQTVQDGLGTGTPLQLASGAMNITSGFSYNSNSVAFGGAFSTANAFTTLGSFGITLTATALSTLTLPSGTDTLVGIAATQTLTNKTLISPIIGTITNTGTLTLPTSSDTIVGRVTTDTLTNKTIDSASNTIKFNGVTSSTVTGTGAVVLATTPTLITPILGVATATSINGLTLTASTGVVTVTNGKTLSVTNTATISTTPITKIAVQTFTATGAYTYTPTTGMVYCTVEIQAGGGGSGGVTGVTSDIATSSAGGSGAYMKLLCTAANVGASCTGSVGIAGTAGTAGGGNNGGAGGNTTFIINSSTWTAAGGLGGTGAIASSGNGTFLGAAGGANTTGSNATVILNVPGSSGDTGFGGNSSFTNSGNGANSLLGQGGRGVIRLTTGSTVGNAASGYGAGASGSVTFTNNTVTATGAAGTQGVVIITEYIAV